MAFGVIDQPVALSGEIPSSARKAVQNFREGAIDSVYPARTGNDASQREYGRCFSPRFSLGIPNAPVQSLDLGHDRRIRGHPSRITGRQSCQFVRMVSRMPIWNQSRIGSSGTPASARMPKARTPVGEGRQRGVAAAANRVEVPSDQPFDVRVASCDGAENLTAAGFRFDIANPHLKPTFSVLAAPYEGGIHDERDRRRYRFPAGSRHGPASAAPAFRVWRRRVLGRCRRRPETCAPADRRSPGRSSERTGVPGAGPVPVSSGNATAN